MILEIREYRFEIVSDNSTCCGRCKMLGRKTHRVCDLCCDLSNEILDTLEKQIGCGTDFGHLELRPTPETQEKLIQEEETNKDREFDLL